MTKVIPIILLVFVVTIIAGSVMIPLILYGNYRNGDLAKATGTGGSGACANISYVDASYMPWVNQASGLYLNNDSAALIAVIKIESSWKPDATNNSSSAAGLGQFLSGTARGMKEFTGGTDSSGKQWDSGKIYDDPHGHPDDARFNAERSIFAAADYLGVAMKNNGNDLFQAYAKGYHTYSNSDQQRDAEAAARAVVTEYNNIKNVGGCTNSPSDNNLVKIAQREIGNKEDPDGADRGPTIDKYEGSGVPPGEKWCGDFVSWVYKQAGLPFTGGEDGGWRLPAAASFEPFLSTHGTWVAITSGRDNLPQPGDILYLINGNQGHVGIVESADSNSLTLISGNSGNQVKRDVYSNYLSSSAIKGWGRIKK